MFRKFLIITVLISFNITHSFAQTTIILKQNILQIINSKKAKIGISIYGFDNNDTLNINGNTHFPMQSVFKLHIAMTVLHEIDKGKLSLNQKILIKKSDLLPDTWSSLREDFPEGNVRLPLHKILSYTISRSDNNGCDILLRLIGGTKIVANFIHKKGITDFSIQVNEEEMHKEWEAQYKNWTTPKASISLLKDFYSKKILTKKSSNFLWKIMTETSTGTNRIKSQLPKGTLVAHKTGTSDTNIEGITAAINDIGIVTLPNGKHFAIGIFVSDSSESEKSNEKIIADITKATWDYFYSKKE
jgi:beta-lactamase class A